MNANEIFDTVREIDLNGVIREIGMESHKSDRSHVVL